MLAPGLHLVDSLPSVTYNGFTLKQGRNSSD